MKTRNNWQVTLQEAERMLDAGHESVEFEIDNMNLYIACRTAAVGTRMQVQKVRGQNVVRITLKKETEK